ncbi:MAG TPA: hypothetical protein VIL28_07665 [Steroidobacteraceae bacterium]
MMSTVVQGGRWYRQPVLWLGVVILLATLAGCISMIMLGARYADEPLSVESERVFKIPTTPEGA